MLGELQVIEVCWKSFPWGSWDLVWMKASSPSVQLFRVCCWAPLYTSMEDTFKDEHIFAIFKSQYIPWL